VLVTVGIGAVAPVLPGQAAPKARLTDGKVVVSTLNDMSGVYAEIAGRNGVRAMEMAVEDFKAKYGNDVLGGPIEVISADHQNKPDVANAKAQEFIDRNGADVIIGVGNSAAALAVANVVKDKQRVYLNVLAATTELTGAQCNKYTFHYTYDTYMLANGTGSAVTKQVGKSWYIIFPNYAYGQDMDRSFQAAIKANGGTVVASEPTPFPNDDFSTFLLKALSMKPEILGTMQAGQDLVNVVKQYNEFRLRDQGIKLAIGLLFDSDITALGPDAYAGTLYTTPWYWNMDAEAREWSDRFHRATGVRPTFSHAGDYSATWQYLEAVRRAGTDEADAVVKALEDYKFDDFFIRNGYIRPQDHRVIHDAYLAEVKPTSEITEPSDHARILATIPAAEAFRSVEAAKAAGCNMP